MDLDSPDEKGVSKRSKLEKVRKDTDGRIVPSELLNEIHPEPHEEHFFNMFFEMYQPEQNFFVVLDAYMRVWGLQLDGEDISLLQVLWRTAESHRAKQQKEKIDNQKKQSKGSGKTPNRPSHRPVRKRR